MIDDAQAVVLAQKGLSVLGADFQIIDTLDVGKIRVNPRVGEGTVLGDGRGLQVGGPRSARGLALGIVVIAVPADESAQVEDRMVADDVRVGGRDVVGVDLGALVGVADVDEGWVGACAVRWSTFITFRLS